MYDLVYKTCDRIKRTIFSHPRLSVKILELEREALYRIEAETGHELGITEDVQHEISLLGTNIWYADRGEIYHNVSFLVNCKVLQYRRGCNSLVTIHEPLYYPDYQQRPYILR